MPSQWSHLKSKAISLRKRGLAIRVIENQLKISRSTLSYWFRDVHLNKRQKQKLFQDWKSALIKARKKAVTWHNEQKDKRLKEAEDAAYETLSKTDTSNATVLDIALAMLYLGEGFKRTGETGIGNSDPMILRFFLAVLKRNYGFDLSSIRCELHLRADQNANYVKKYWAKELHLPLETFKYVVKDKRTEGVPTYPRYKGVCLLRCANVVIQRKLVYLSQQFCEKVIKESRA